MELGRNLKIDSISRLRPSAPHRVRSDQTAECAIRIMREKKVGCVLVCEDSRLIGIFTERDLMRRILSAGKPLSTCLIDCMTPNPVIVSPKDPIRAAIKKMEEGGYRHLPVVSDQGEPIGILSVKDIIRYLVEHFPATVYNLPPNPKPFQIKREGA